MNKTVILVDDNPDDSLLMIRAIKKSGNDVNIVVLNSGAEALDYFFCRGNHQDRDVTQQSSLILLDLKLPKISGHDVLKQLRSDKRTQCLPIVVTSTSNEPSDVELSYRLGANSYIRKPVDFNTLVVVVGKLCEYWLNINFPAPETTEWTLKRSSC